MDLTPIQFMILAQFIIFILGWPLEWTEIIVIFMPIFIPLLAHFQIDPLFFGLLVALNLQTAFLSPPVAMAAFYLKGVSPPHVTLNQIFGGHAAVHGHPGRRARAAVRVSRRSGSGCRRRSTSDPRRRRCVAAAGVAGVAFVASASNAGGAMLVSEILRIKGNTLFTTAPDGTGPRRGQGDGAERHRLAGRHGPRQARRHADVPRGARGAREARRHARRRHASTRSTSAIR